MENRAGHDPMEPSGGYQDTSTGHDQELININGISVPRVLGERALRETLASPTPETDLDATAMPVDIFEAPIRLDAEIGQNPNAEIVKLHPDNVIEVGNKHFYLSQPEIFVLNELAANRHDPLALEDIELSTAHHFRRWADVSHIAKANIDLMASKLNQDKALLLTIRPSDHQERYVLSENLHFLDRRLADRVQKILERPDTRYKTRLVLALKFGINIPEFDSPGKLSSYRARLTQEFDLGGLDNETTASLAQLTPHEARFIADKAMQGKNKA